MPHIPFPKADARAARGRTGHRRPCSFRPRKRVLQRGAAGTQARDDRAGGAAPAEDARAPRVRRQGGRAVRRAHRDVVRSFRAATGLPRSSRVTPKFVRMLRRAQYGGAGDRRWLGIRVQGGRQGTRRAGAAEGPDGPWLHGSDRRRVRTLDPCERALLQRAAGLQIDGVVCQGGAHAEEGGAHGSRGRRRLADAGDADGHPGAHDGAGARPARVEPDRGCGFDSRHDRRRRARHAPPGATRRSSRSSRRATRSAQALPLRRRSHAGPTRATTAPARSARCTARA